MSRRSSAKPPRDLVLASTSPYRQALLERLGLPFDVVAPGTDETPLPGELPAALARRLAHAKAVAAASGLAGPALVIGSDQVAVCGGVVHGKPGDHAGAVRQLRAASGHSVRFLTALCVLDTATARTTSDLDATEVQFRTLGDAEIEAYVTREQPFDCAGAFKVEGLGIALFERVTSVDPTALTGLPLIALCRRLREAGIAVVQAGS